MNLITFWNYGINNKGFKYLLDELKIKKCHYLYNSDDEKEFIHSVEHAGINIYQNPAKYNKDINNLIPIDNKLVQIMNPYEVSAMDIFFRWRRSMTTKESYYEIKKLYYLWLRYWNDYILKNEINLCIINCIPHIPITFMIYAICKAHNIPVVTAGMMPIFWGSKQNIFFGGSIGGLDNNFKNRYVETLDSYCEGQITNVDLRLTFEEYFKNYNEENADEKRVILIESGNKWRKKISEVVSRIKIYLSQKRYFILVNKIKYYCIMGMKSKQIFKYFKRLETEPDLEKKFLFFPLHFQPEATTLPSGGIFADQLLIVKMISKYLPENVLLYVKEHPTYGQITERVESATEARSKEFYNEIIGYENVKLISHDYNSLELIEKCKGLVTVTGTAGWEAIFKHKPVLMFGDFFYSSAPGVYRIYDNEDCKMAIETILSKDIEIKDKELRAFLKTMEPITAEIADNRYFEANGFPVYSDDLNSELIAKTTINFIKMEYPDLI